MSFTNEVKKKLTHVIYTCIENELVIDYVPASNGLMIMSRDYKVIASMWVDSDDQLKELDRIYNSIVHFLKEETVNETNKTVEFKVS